MSGGTWGERAALARVDPTHTWRQGHQDGLVLLRSFGDMSWMGGLGASPWFLGSAPAPSGKARCKTLRQSRFHIGALHGMELEPSEEQQKSLSPPKKSPLSCRISHGGVPKQPMERHEEHPSHSCPPPEQNTDLRAGGRELSSPQHTMAPASHRC